MKKYGLFKWNEAGIYNLSDAIKTYQSKKVAEKSTYKMNSEVQGSNIVVITLSYCNQR